MTFLQMQNAVLANSFSEAHRDDAKRWINIRYAKLVDLEEWNFRYGVQAVTVTSGSSDVTNLPADLAIVLSLQRHDGVTLAPIEDIRDFMRRYYNADVALTGLPESFCVIGSAVKVGPASNETSTAYELAYQKSATQMTADSEYPIIPWQYHSTIVAGAKVDGMRELGVSLWAWYGLDEGWKEDVAAMQRTYLTTIRAAGEPFSGQFIPGRA